MKIGIFLGKFSPPHIGHLNAIKTFTSQLDRLYLCPAFTIGETISLKVRISWLRELTKDLPNVKIEPITEQIKTPPNNDQSDEETSRVWSAFLKNKFPDATHFCGGEEYIEMMARFQNMQSIRLERDQYKASNISAFKNLKDCASKTIKNQLIPRVMVTGIESAGKTTVLTHLSSLFNCEVVQEWGRLYCELNSDLLDSSDYFLNRDDFTNKPNSIILGHNKLIVRAFEKAVTLQRDLVLVDTDHIVTYQFYKRYFNEQYSQYIHDACRSQKFDLVIFLEQLPFTQDGTRREEQKEERDKLEGELLELYRSYGQEVVRIPALKIEERVKMVQGVINRLLEERRRQLQ